MTFHRCLLALAGRALGTELPFRSCTLPQHNNNSSKCHYCWDPSISGHFALLYPVGNYGLSHTWISAMCSSLLLQSGACKHVLTGHVLLQ